MPVDAISNQKTIAEIISAKTSNSKNRNTGELGKDDFLNLLVTQLRYQDPLKPMEDKEFIAQMAQFSSLEQMQNMNTSFESVKAFSLIGKRIAANIVDEATGEVRMVEGDVSAVKMSNGKTFVVVRGEDIPVGKITDVTQGLRSLESNISTYTNLIGFNVKGAVYDPQTGEIVGVNGQVKSIQKGVYEDYAVIDGVKVEISEIITTEHKTNPNFKQDYLDAHIGKEIQVYVIDRESGHRVPVIAKLREYTLTGSNISAVLDEVYVPVDSVSSISPLSKTMEEDYAAGNEIYEESFDGDENVVLEADSENTGAAEVFGKDENVG